MEKAKGPQFLRFCIPIIEALKELGGSGQPSESIGSITRLCTLFVRLLVMGRKCQALKPWQWTAANSPAASSQPLRF
jgi:hypothetical protein